MICRICGKIFSDAVTFQTMFQYKPFCSKCEQLYKPEFIQEVIPFDGGEIHYYSVYSKQAEDPHIERMLYRHMRAYFRLLDVMDLSNWVVILIDSTGFSTFSSWFPSIKSLGSVALFSIFHYDFSQYEDSV